MLVEGDATRAVKLRFQPYRKREYGVYRLSALQRSKVESENGTRQARIGGRPRNVAIELQETVAQLTLASTRPRWCGWLA